MSHFDAQQIVERKSSDAVNKMCGDKKKKNQPSNKSLVSNKEELSFILTY